MLTRGANRMTDRSWMDTRNADRPGRISRRGRSEVTAASRVLRFSPESGSSAGDRIERWLQQLVVLALVAVVVIQMLLTHPAVRQMLVLAERMEGSSVLPDGSVIPAFPLVPARQSLQSDPQSRANAVPVIAAAPSAHAVPASAAAARVKLMVTNRPTAPEVWLLADGQVVGDFRRGEATATVRPGSHLQVDARNAAALVRFRVVETTGALEPRLGLEVVARPGEVAEVAVAR